MKFAKFLIQWHFDIERASLQGLNSRFEFNALRKSWFNQPFKFSALFKIYHKILKKFSQDCCEFLTKFLNNFYKKFTKFSQKTQRILTKSLQKFKKFKEFLRNSLNFPQNFQTLFTNSRKILKHFLQKLAKLSNNSCKMRANFPQKFAQPKKLAQKTCSIRSPKKAHSKNLLCLLTQKAHSIKKSSPKSSLKSLLQELHYVLLAGVCLRHRVRATLG